MKNVIISILLLSTLYSCGEKSPIPETVFTKNSFERVSVLESEIVEFDKALNPMAFEVVHDSIIFVQNWNSAPGSFFEFYCLNTFELLGVYGVAGRGPNEFVGPMVTYNNNVDNGFIINDVNLKKGSFHNIDSVLLLGNAYAPDKFSVPNFIFNLVLYDSVTAIGYNSFYLGEFKFGNRGAEPLYIFKSNEYTDFEKEFKRHRYFTLNEGMGHLAVSPDKGRIIIFYHFVNRIDVFNGDFKLERRLHGPGVRQPEFQVLNNVTDEVGQKGAKVTAYWRIFYNHEHIFALYQGNREDGASIAPSTEVHKFGWNGELIHRYILSREPGMRFGTISVDSEEMHMYCTLSRSREGKLPQLVKFRLPDSP
jgi:hypothetical protein